MEEKRSLTLKEKEYFLSLKYDDISKTLLQDLFARKYDPKTNKTSPAKFHTYDEFTLKKGESFNTEEVRTNCGLYIVNIFLFEPLKSIVGYVNEPLSKKAMGKINSKIDAALLENRITAEQYIKYLNDATWLRFIINTEVSTSLTINSMKELPAVKKRKQELIKQNKDKIEAGDVSTAASMEKELLDIARKELKDDPAMELYDSGARGAFDVAYKSAQVMTGAVYNSSKGKYDIMTNSLANGVDKGDIPTLANSVVDGSYSKAISTGECGYLTKKLAAAFQSEMLDKPGSDCGSKGYNEVTLTKGNKHLYMYCYMIEGSNLVRFDPSNEDKYIGKTVKFRSLQYCTSKKNCNKCAGDLYYFLGIENIGLTVPKLSGTLLNKRMKVFHDPNVKVTELDINKDFS